MNLSGVYLAVELRTGDVVLLALGGLLVLGLSACLVYKGISTLLKFIRRKKEEEPEEEENGPLR